MPSHLHKGAAVIEHSCGIGECECAARWVLAGSIECAAATFLCTLHWGILKASHPEYAYMYCPVGAVSADLLEGVAVVRLDERGTPVRE